jgi:cell division protein FtsB
MTLIMLIAILWLAFSVVKLKDQSTSDKSIDHQVQQLSQQITVLKERIATLEKLATDDASTLKRDIDAL